MSQLNLFHQFKENIMKGVHDFTNDSSCNIKAALCAAANAPVATNSVLADLVEIAYTNLSSRLLSGVTAEHSSGVVPFTANNLTLTASGGSVAAFRYVALYDDVPSSPADPLIGWWDVGSSITLLDTQIFIINLTAGRFGRLQTGA